MRLAVAMCLISAACVVGDDPEVDDPDIAMLPAIPHGVTLGMHDGAINHCDNSERWTTNPANLAATAGELANSAWWTPLNVGTVRVSVPWDIALPNTLDAGVVTAHDPAGWREQHLAALAKEQQCLAAWMFAARVEHETIDIAFKPDYDYRDASTNHILVPDMPSYRKAVAAFVHSYGPGTAYDVHILTPWGEPDYASGHYPRSSTDRSKGCTDGCQGNALPALGITRAKEVFFLPAGSSGMDAHRARFDEPNCSDERDNTCGPVMAAQMWMAVFHECPGCKLTTGAHAGDPGSGVLAGDFSGGGGLNGYLTIYARHLNNCAGCGGERPPVWALHPYPDASNEEWCLAKTGHDYAPQAEGGKSSVTVRFLDAMDAIGYHEHTSVWFDEVSVFAHDNYEHSSTTPPRNTLGKSCGTNTSGTKPTYSPDVEGKSVQWLVRTLPRVRGTRNPGHEPVIDRIYYFRSFTGSDPNGDNITPTNPTPNQAALYHAIVTR